MARHRSSAVPLAWLYGALIVYASLYPFVGWRVPGVAATNFLLLGWPRYWTTFDLVANLLGYLPLGFLLFLALIRGGRSALVAALLACAGGTLLSLVMELLQNYLPHRVASNVDRDTGERSLVLTNSRLELRWIGGELQVRCAASQVMLGAAAARVTDGG